MEIKFESNESFILKSDECFHAFEMDENPIFLNGKGVYLDFVVYYGFNKDGDGKTTPIKEYLEINSVIVLEAYDIEGDECNITPEEKKALSNYLKNDINYEI